MVNFNVFLLFMVGNANDCCVVRILQPHVLVQPNLHASSQLICHPSIPIDFPEPHCVGCRTRPTFPLATTFEGDTVSIPILSTTVSINQSVDR
jgi:hypothetical protein